MSSGGSGSDQQVLCKCNTCQREIPISAALTAEGADYVWHFCGKPCYEKWLSEKDHS